MFADGAAGNAVLPPVPVSDVSSACIPDSSSGIDLFCLCCPLPLAVNDASFMSRFASGSIGFSHGSGAADSVSGTAAVALSLLFFLCSPLRTSSASASLITSFPRSNLSAPCGVVLRHSSIRILQRTECACALLLSLIALQFGHPIVAPNSSMSCLVILSLWIRAPSNGYGGIGMGSTQASGLSTVHLPPVILHGTPITLLTASVSHLLCGSNLMISRALKKPSAIPVKHSALLFRIPSQIPT